MYKIVRFALQIATQNCLDCYSKLNLASKFHAEVATRSPHIVLRQIKTLVILYKHQAYKMMYFN